MKLINMNLERDSVAKKLLLKAENVTKRNRVFLSIFIIMNAVLGVLVYNIILENFSWLLVVTTIDAAIYFLYFLITNQMSFEEISYLKGKIKLPKLREEILYTIGDGYIYIYKKDKLIKYEVDVLDDLEKDAQWVEEYSPQLEYSHYRGLFVRKGIGDIVQIPNEQ